MKKVLGLQSLPTLSNSVITPSYNLENLGIGILHIGLGRFHRGHQAVFNDLCLNRNGGNWGIAAVSLNTRRTVDALNQQDGLYSVQLNSVDGSKTKIVGCIRKAHFVGDGMSAVNQHFTNPSVHIATLTVTEKGYHYDSSTRSLDHNSSDLKKDLEAPQNPCTAIGLLARGLELRFERSAGPINVLSCDNLQANGSLLQSLVVEYLECIKSSAVKWVRDQVAFPNSMVDRIVPSIDDAEIDQLNQQRSFIDAIPIVTEDFGQWIIEDGFTAPRPQWQDVGVQFVKDVHIFEKLKLSMLNGTHSYMAYFGSLKGYRYVNEAIADEEIYTNVSALLSKQLSNYISSTEELSLQSYSEALIQRYRNPELKHRLLQIAMDGSLKIPQRWIPSVLHALKNNQPTSCLSGCIASWILFCQMAEKGRWEMNDPLRATILSAVGNSSDPVAILRSLPQIFPEEIFAHQGFANEITQTYQQLRSRFLK